MKTFWETHVVDITSFTLTAEKLPEIVRCCASLGGALLLPKPIIVRVVDQKQCYYVATNHGLPTTMIHEVQYVCSRNGHKRDQ